MLLKIKMGMWLMMNCKPKRIFKPKIFVDTCEDSECQPCPSCPECPEGLAECLDCPPNHRIYCDCRQQHHYGGGITTVSHCYCLYDFYFSYGHVTHFVPHQDPGELPYYAEVIWYIGDLEDE